MEPLVGLMRDPFTPEECVPHGEKKQGLGSRRYLLINALVRTGWRSP